MSMYKYMLLLVDRDISLSTEDWIYQHMLPSGMFLVLMPTPWMHIELLKRERRLTTRLVDEVYAEIVGGGQMRAEKTDWLTKFSILRREAAMLGFYGSRDSFERVLFLLVEPGKHLRVYVY